MKHVLLGLLLVAPFISPAQDSAKSSFKLFGERWQTGSINVSWSLSNDRYYRGYSFDDLKKNYPENNNFYPIKSGNFSWWGNSDGPAVSYHANVSFYPYNNKQQRFNENHELRLGATLNTGKDYYLSSYNSNYLTRYPGPSKDTTFLSSISYTQKMDELGVEIFYLFRSKPFFKRLTLFGGIGAGFNFTIFSELEESVRLTTMEQDTSSGNFYYSMYRTYDTSNRKFKGNFAYTRRIIVPFGIDFRIIEAVNLYIEFRKEFSFQRFKGSSFKTRTLEAVGLGCRVRI